MSEIVEKSDNKRWAASFFTIAIGQTVSLIGSAAVQFALIWWIASETGSPMNLAFSTIFAFLPQFVLGPFAGVWIDRLKRKTIIIAADLFLGFVAVVFAVFFLTGTPPFWSVYIVLFIRAVGSVFHTPAIQSAIPMLVPPEHLIKANSWSQFMQSGAFMLGPVVGALMLGVFPIWVILLSDLVGAVVASLTVAAVKIPDPPRAQSTPHFFREMAQGAKTLLSDKPLAIVSVLAIAGMFFFIPLASFYPLMTSSYFSLDAVYASVVEFAYAAGMMLCSVLLGSFVKIKAKFGGMHIGMFGMGITAFLSGMLPSSMPGFWLFAVISLFMGASGNIYNISFISYLQATIPPDEMGRVFSLIGSATSLTTFGVLIAAPIAARYGVAVCFLVCGLIFTLISTVSAVWVSRIKAKT
jgi:Major Facilitator Superfamily.